MSVTPLGNVIQINQNTHIVANKVADIQNRFDIQSLAANEIAKDKNKEIEEVRPTKESYKVKEDKEQPNKNHQQKQEDKDHLDIIA